MRALKNQANPMTMKQIIIGRIITNYSLTNHLENRLTFNTAFFYTREKDIMNNTKRTKIMRLWSTLSYERRYSVHESDLVRQLWLDNYFYGNIFSLQYKNDKTQATLGGG